MKQEVTVPDIGDFEDVEVVEVLVSVGDHVEIEASLISIESDKATLEVPSPVAGRVSDLHVSLGDRVSEGSPVATIETGDAAGEQAPRPAAAAEPADAAATGDGAPQARAGDADGAAAPIREAPREGRDAGEREGGDDDPAPTAVAPLRPDAHAAPSVRRTARELGVDLAGVKGSGPKGRILRADVQEHVRSALQSPGPGAPAAAALPQVDASRFGPVETEELGTIRRVTARRMHASWVTVPHVTQFDEADITELEAFRKSRRDAAEARGTKLTLLPFVIRAVVAALHDQPRFRSSLDPGGESITIKQYFHIGVAVDTPGGLMVPVVRDADQKGLLDLAAELADLGERARTRKLKPDEMQGGCFTISSLGGIGGTQFTPIVNPPEVAILGLSRHRMQPVYRDGSFEPRLMLPISLSYDHRVIDGADGARFAARLCADLTDIRSLLL